MCVLEEEEEEEEEEREVVSICVVGRRDERNVCL